ncbi:MAG: hypothetical protein H7Y30_07775 [Pyrinomonadaceae bacterium]|nr:hypothetical protein [Pyrinomonadaceae bacterium]
MEIFGNWREAEVIAELRWFNKSREKTVFGKISKICGKNYDDEFKRYAVNKVLDGQSVVSVAQELDPEHEPVSLGD